MSADLIILAAIAIFVGLRLRAVLGRKIGHSDPTPVEPGEGRVVQVPPRALPTNDPEAVLASAAEPLREQLRELLKQDPSFTLSEFVKGARVAFEMVIEAYGKGDRDSLKNLLSREVYDNFARVLDADAKEGRRQETTLVAILSVEATDIAVKKSVARISLKIESEQIHLVRDAEDKLIEGDVSHVETVEDEWSFERDLRSNNPNWKIVAT